MLLELNHRSLYAAFDCFPSYKGAGTHIFHMASTLFDFMGEGLLSVLGHPGLPLYQREHNIEIFRYQSEIPNFLERTLRYGVHLEALLKEQEKSLVLCHFRDIWSGIPILRNPSRKYSTVFEVNAFPSIELPFAYPQISSSTLDKIREGEHFCWKESDKIITPSRTIRDNLVALGVSPEKITVIPNGAEPGEIPPRPQNAPDRYALYFGTIQSWQGIEILLKAFPLLADWENLKLVMCLSTDLKKAKMIRKLAEKLNIDSQILWQCRMEKEELNAWIGHALFSIAPLTECSRNLAQGCSPLKILESMALGIPVIASDLPSVREIISDGEDGKLVRPGRPGDLARAIRLCLEYPEQLKKMGQLARKKIEHHFTWKKSREMLTGLYRSLKPDGGFPKG